MHCGFSGAMSVCKSEMVASQSDSSKTSWRIRSELNLVIRNSSVTLEKTDSADAESTHVHRTRRTGKMSTGGRS
jgi:hypothetical protein